MVHQPRPTEKPTGTGPVCDGHGNGLQQPPHERSDNAAAPTVAP